MEKSWKERIEDQVDRFRKNEKVVIWLYGFLKLNYKVVMNKQLK